MDIFIIVVDIMALAICGIVLWVNHNTFILSRMTDRRKRYVRKPNGNEKKNAL